MVHAEPNLTAAAVTNGPMSGGAMITLAGNDFSSLDPTPTIRLHVSTCMTSMWTSRTSIHCAHSAAGSARTAYCGSGAQGLMLAVRVEGAGLGPAMPAMFTFDGATTLIATACCWGVLLCSGIDVQIAWALFQASRDL